MQFEWDEEKARKNLAKHHVDFDEAKDVCDDPFHMIFLDRFEDGEQQRHAVGAVGPVVLLLVVHIYPDTDNDTRVRIIGARKASRQERRRYEQESS